MNSRRNEYPSEHYLVYPEYDMEYEFNSQTDESRISQLFRQLRRNIGIKGEYKTVNELFDKLAVKICEPTNKGYVNRSFDSLADCIVGLLLESPDSYHPQIIHIFSLIGLVNQGNFSKYFNFIFKCYKATKELRVQMLESLRGTINMNCKIPSEMVFKIMKTLKELMEKVEEPEIFICIGEILHDMVIFYPKVFEKFFTDIVDIVIGWHLERDQKNELKMHCCRLLQSLSAFWGNDTNFTRRLMDQFVEDIENSEGESSKETHFGCFIGAFNTVMKSLRNPHHNGEYFLEMDFISKCFIQILTSAEKIFASNEFYNGYEVVVNTNEFLIIVLESQVDAEILDRVIGLLKIQLDLIANLDDDQIMSVIFTLTKLIKCILIQPDYIEFIQNLFDSEDETSLLKKRFSRNKKMGFLLIELFKEILNLKNVQILKHIYTAIISDLNAAIKSLNGDSEKYTKEQAKFVIISNLSILSKLALDNTSIIALYACQPSLLEVFTINLEPLNENLWRDHSSVYKLVLNIIAEHCRTNKNFAISSNMLKNIPKESNLNYAKESPTCEHFEMILSFLPRVLILDLDHHSLLTMLQWVFDFLNDIKFHESILVENDNFHNLVINLLSITEEATEIDVLRKCSKCLEILIGFELLPLTLKARICQVTCKKLSCLHQTVRDDFCRILCKLPLNLTLPEINNQLTDSLKYEAQIKEMIYATKSEPELWPILFEKFFKFVDFQSNAQTIEEFLGECFEISFKIFTQSDMEFNKSVLNNVDILIAWMQWELAHFCVNNKLRTPFGKPQDTFLKIEGLVKKMARIIDGKEIINIHGIEHLKTSQFHARIILGLFEALEKCIYNASEGTAYTFPVLEKPIKSFFRLNSSTCKEWFKRNRTALGLVSFNEIDSETVVRSSEEMLKELEERTDENRTLYEHSLVYLVKGLLNLNDSDALEGVYKWSNQKWIKAASFQAAFRYELAVEEYKAQLQNLQNNYGTTTKIVKEFIKEQLLMCLYFSGRIIDINLWLKEEDISIIQKSTLPFTDFFLKNEISNSTSDFIYNNLTNWDLLMSENTFNSNQFSIPNVLFSIQNSLPIENHGTEEANASLLNFYIQESVRTRSKENINYLITLNHVIYKLDDLKKGLPINTNSLTIDKSFGSRQLLQTLNLARMIGVYANSDLTDMVFHLISTARKEHNLHLARVELENYFSNSIVKLCTTEKLSLEIIPKLLQLNGIQDELWDKNMMRAVYETSKLLYCKAETRESAIELSAFIAFELNNKMKLNPDKDSRILFSKILLKLSEWVQLKDDKDSEKLEKPNMISLINCLDDIETDVNIKNDLIISNEISARKLLASSVKLCPDIAKTWSAFGGWCYRWGKKIVELSRSEKHRKTLQFDLNKEIKTVVKRTSPDEIKAIINTLDELLMTDNDSDDIGPNEGDAEELVEKYLKNLNCLKDVSKENIQKIISMWHKAHKHVYGYYELSATAYFKYLQLVTSEEESGEEDKMNCSSIMATLRLLRLIVKHALGLQDVLEEGLASTPSGPWKAIIPQLFSRLNHHEPYVRRRMSELLCRVAHNSPQIILFPAVVGCSQGKQIDLSKVLLLTSDSKCVPESKPTENRDLLSCFHSLLQTLSNQSPETVTQVQVLVHELQRICLLWDELWLVSFTKLYAEHNKGLNHFEQAIANQKFSDLDRDVLLKTIGSFKQSLLLTVDKIIEITSVKPETPHENLFQSKYQKYIDVILEEAKKPVDKKCPLKTWHLFKNFFGVLHQRSSKRSSNTLNVKDISPILYAMKDTLISMPGIDNYNSSSICLKSVGNIVHILPTKTKPKKLLFVGSDNKNYNYLFKGLEDLHLDERIMQFLSISNTLMKKSSKSIGHGFEYRARYYSVIPLGIQSGLIRWVDGVVPIFSLYKKWQQRESAKAKKTNDKEATIMRPSELYYNKLTPLLNAQKVDVSDNRKLWPVSILKQVLQELSNETPKDLLAKELWCNSTTASDWRQTVKNYSLSVAVMSVIGYIIGLGDRHLDNVLVDLSSGEILHIDYNVCFEKGKTLRVPEKVPFRMTPNFREALGLTGVEGTFRLTCENVLKSLKRGRETLLTLLEAFVYDPLVDWTVNPMDLSSEASRADKKESKVQERSSIYANTDNQLLNVKTQWKQNRDDIQKKFQNLKEALFGLEKVVSDITTMERDLNGLSIQKQLLSESDEKTLQNLVEKYLDYTKCEQSYTTIKTIIQDCLNWSSKIIEKHEQFREDENDILSQSVEKLKGYYSHVCLTEFDIIRPVFEIHNCLNLFIQCNQLSTEIANSIFNMGQVLLEIKDLINQYKLIIGYLPNNKNCNHILNKYKNWCQQFLELEEDVNDTHLINEISTEIGSPNLLVANPQILSNFSYQLVGIIHEIAYQHQNTVQFLEAEEKDFILITDKIPKVIQSIQETANNQDKIVISGLWETIKQFNSLESNESENLPGKKFNLYDISSIINVFLKQTQILPEKTQFKLGIEVTEKYFDVCEWTNGFKAAFTGDIIPMTMKAVIGEDTNMIDMIATICGLQQNCNLKMLHRQLSLDLQTILNSSTSILDSYKGLDQIKEIKLKYKNLYSKITKSNEKNSGDDFFVKFNDFFRTLFTKFRLLVEICKKVKRPQGLVSSTFPLAMMLQKYPKMLELVEGIFFVKELDAMIDFLTLVLKMVCALKGAGECVIYNDQWLFDPVKQVIDDFLNTIFYEMGQFTIVSTFECIFQKIAKDNNYNISLDDYLNSCHVVDLKYKDEMEEIRNYWNKCFKIDHLKKIKENQELEMKRLQLLKTCHEWIHEEFYEQINQSTGSRMSLLIQAKGLTQKLNGWSATIAKMRQEQFALLQPITDDMKWAESTLKPLIGEFEKVTERKNAVLDKYQHCAVNSLTSLEILLNFEMMRKKNSEVIDKIREIITLIDKANQLKQQLALLTKDEKLVLSLVRNPENDQITEEWKIKLTDKINDHLQNLNGQMLTLSTNKDISEQYIYGIVEELQKLMNAHQKLLGIILGYKTDNEPNGDIVQNSLRLHETFIDQMNNVLLIILNKDWKQFPIETINEKVSQIVQHFDEVLGNLSKNIDQLRMEEDQRDCMGRLKSRSEVQPKQNLYAVGVWRRIRMKLEGKDPDPSKRATVQEQVDWMIKEAINVDNLAVLYEGWTPWV